MSVMTWPSAPAASPLLRQCGAALGDRVLRLQDEPLAILKALYRLGALVVTCGLKSLPEYALPGVQ